MLMNRKT